MDKKKIMKKHCGTGKGGIISDAYKNVKDAVSRTGTKVKDAITSGIVKFVGDTPAGKILKEGLDNQKAQILKGVIKKSTEAPTDVTTKAPQVLYKIPTAVRSKIKKYKIAEWEKKHPIENTSDGVGVGY